MVHNGMVEGLHSLRVGCLGLTPHCVPLVMLFSCHALVKLSMTLARLSAAKSLCYPAVSQLLGELVV